MAHDVQGCLQATGGGGEQVCIVCDTHNSDVKGTKVEAEVSANKREESRIHVNFEVAASSDLALTVALLLYHSPAELVLHI